MIFVGQLRLQSLHTPGHTRDSVCLCVEDRVFTGDTLLIGATGRTDLPSGDAEALYDVEMMQSLNLTMPTHLTEALRTNMSGGKTVAQMLSDAAACVPFMSLAELNASLENRSGEMLVLDVRERDAYEAGHIPGAMHLPRGQLELRVNEDLKDPTRRILVCCEFGRISTLATATLRAMGFQGAVALDGGMKAWREANNAMSEGKEP